VRSTDGSLRTVGTRLLAWQEVLGTWWVLSLSREL
jgi:hypothetical protein